MEDDPVEDRIKLSIDGSGIMVSGCPGPGSRKG